MSDDGKASITKLFHPPNNNKPHVSFQRSTNKSPPPQRSPPPPCSANVNKFKNFLSAYQTFCDATSFDDEGPPNNMTDAEAFTDDGQPDELHAMVTNQKKGNNQRTPPQRPGNINRLLGKPPGSA